MTDDEIQPTFDANVKPMFRELDRKEMLWALDLWKHKDVAGNAEDILIRLEAGDMPCDAPWPSERIATFRSWIEGGMP